MSNVKRVAEKANKTIEICDLNRNNLWILYRKKKIDEIFEDISKQLNFYLLLLEKPILLTELDCFKSLFKTIFEKIKNKTTNENELSSVFCFIYENFDYIIDKHKCFNNRLDKDKNIVKEAFNLFKTNKLA